MFLLVFVNAVCGIGKTTIANAMLSKHPDRVRIVSKDAIWRKVTDTNSNASQKDIRMRVNSETIHEVETAFASMLANGISDGIVVMDRNIPGMDRTLAMRFAGSTMPFVRLVVVGFDWEPARDGMFLSHGLRPIAGLSNRSVSEILCVMNAACDRMLGTIDSGDRDPERTRASFIKFWASGNVVYSMTADVVVPVWNYDAILDSPEPNASLTIGFDAAARFIEETPPGSSHGIGYHHERSPVMSNVDTIFKHLYGSA